jgi:hypothetical protein
VAAAEAASEVSVHEDWGTVTGEVVDEAGRAAPLAFQRAGGRLVGTIERLKAKGYYKVELKGGQPGKPREGHTQVAANVAPGESDFQTLDQAGLRALMPSARVTVVDASAEAQQLYGNIGDEREVWRPMIWVLFAVIGVEFALATMRAGRAKRRAGAALLQQVEQMLPDAFDDAQRGATTKVTP